MENNNDDNTTREQLIQLLGDYIRNMNTATQSINNNNIPVNNFYTRHHNRNINTNQDNNNDLEDFRRLLQNLILNYNNNMSLYQDNIRSLTNILRLLFTSTNTRRHNNSYSNSRYNSPFDFDSTPFSNTFGRTTTRQTNTERDAWQRTNSTFFTPNNIRQGLFTNVFENVIVRPTQQQIENATRFITYNSEEPTINTTCPITIEEFENDEILTQIRHCRHTFRTSAINNWFNSSVRCPVCRYDIRDYRPSTNDVSNNIPNIVDNSHNAVRNNSPVNTTSTTESEANEVNIENISTDDLINQTTNYIQNIMTNLLNNQTNENGLNSHVITLEIPITTFSDNSMNEFPIQDPEIDEVD